MSTLNVENISDGTSTITINGTSKGSAKAWVNFDGTGTIAIRSSFNVNSITDNGTGKYKLNFTTALEDVNYSATASVTAAVVCFLVF